MTIAIWYWLIMALWLIVGLWSEYVPGQPYPVWRGGRHLIMFILFVIIGWHLFGSPVK